MAFLKRAVPKFGAVLQQPVNIGDVKLYLNSLPSTFPCYLVVDYGTGVEEIRTATSSGINFVNCDAAVSPHAINGTVQCLDVAPYINDIAGLYETDHNSDGSHQISNFGLSDFVFTGCNIPTSVGLSTTMGTGVAFITGKRIVVPSDGGFTYTANKDTYVDVDNTGTAHYIAVANGATAPSLTASSIRIAVVISNGTAIPTVKQTGFDNINTPIYPISPATITPVSINNKYRMSYNRNGSVQGIPNNGATVVCNNKEYDNDGNYNASNGQYTIAVAGDYLITGGVEFQGGSSSGKREIYISSTVQGQVAKSTSSGYSSSDTTAVSIARILRCAVGEIITIFAYQDSGGSININNNPDTFFSVRLLSI